MKAYFEKIYTEGFNSFIQDVKTKMIENEKCFVVTANPETLMIGQNSAEFDSVLKSDEVTIVPDGIGVVKAANSLGYPVKERVTGVEIVAGLLNLLNEQKKSVYFFGAKDEVISKLVTEVAKEYPNICICGWKDGYVADRDAVFDDIVRLEPDVVFVALGIPYQEMLIAKHYERFKKGIFVGVGGAFDVISGTKKRAPKIFIKLNLEWLYRIVCEPKRIKRFYDSNVRFIEKIRKMRNQNEN